MENLDPRRVTKNRWFPNRFGAFGHELFPERLPGVRFINQNAIRARAGLLLIVGVTLLVIRIDHGNHYQFVLPPDYAVANQLEGGLFSSTPQDPASAENASAQAHSHDGGHARADSPNTAGSVYTCPMHSDVLEASPGKCGQCGMDLVRQAKTETMPPLVRRTYDHKFAQGLIWLVWLDMLLATLFGLAYAPVGILAKAFTWNQIPEWTPAPPKRAAWLLGTLLATLCQAALTWGLFMDIALYALFVCIGFMFLESAIGLCVVCWFYGWLARFGLIRNPI